MRHATIALPLIALLSAFTASCGKDAPETLVRLIIDSDLEVGTELTKLEVRIFDRDGEEELRRQDFALGAKREGARYTLPLSIKLAPDSQGSSADFRLVVTGIGPIGEGGSDVEVVEQQATASFRPGQALRLDVFLARTCLFKLCRDDGALSRLTCSASTGDCAGIPTRENLPVVTGDGVREYEDEKSEAGAIVSTADDGGRAESDSGGREDSNAPLDSAVGDGATADAATANLADASRPDGSALLTDAASDASGSNICNPNPCLNGSTCSPTGTLCACAAGFAGAKCETNVCQPNPCGINGTCMPSGSSYSCTCKTGYVGTGSQRCDVAFTKVASGSASDNACALLSDGRVACWGSNEERSTFADSRTSIPSPAIVATAGGSELAVGARFACSSGSGGIACWGTNEYGQLGNGSTQPSLVPVRVNQPFTIRRISAGWLSTCSLVIDGTVICWGNNNLGQVGSGSWETSRELVTAPRAVTDLYDAVDVSVGSDHACAARLNASPVCWGNGNFGALGNGLQMASFAPVAVVGLQTPTRIAQVSAGLNFSCALNASGTVECWGRNDSGSLGNGTQVPSGSPVAVRNLTDAIAIAAGAYHACALRANRQVVCWGWNGKGQLGDGTLTTSNLPVTVQNLTDVDAITSGFYFSCARLRSGNLYCWGSNLHGELGNGMRTGDSPVPVLVDFVR